jgi:hypothetical protein
MQLKKEILNELSCLLRRQNRLKSSIKEKLRQTLDYQTTDQVNAQKLESY